jgi:hypothetical protein
MGGALFIETQLMKEITTSEVFQEPVEILIFIE